MTSFAAAPQNFCLCLETHQKNSGSFKPEGEGRLKPRKKPAEMLCCT